MASLPASYDTDMAEGPEAAIDETMDDIELLSVLSHYEASAIGYEPGGDDEISAAQDRALNYYNRIMDDLPAQSGSSSVIDGTVQVVVDNALASILKPFVSSDEAVMFSPRSEEDVETAEQATEYVNYIFNCENPGFQILHDWFKDALLAKLGVVKVWWESNPRLEGDEVEFLDEFQAAMIRQNPKYMGDDGAVAFIGEEIDDGRVRVVNVPPEEFRITPLARSIDDAPYVAHVPNHMTRSDLLELGFDAEIVDGLPSGTAAEDSSVRQSRFHDEGGTDSEGDSPERSQDKMAFRDEYVRVDYDGDGIAELRRIMRVGDVILSNKEWDEAPFATICPVPIPHKVYGLSLADLSVEIQKINTALWRQMLDNLYKSNNPRPLVGEGAQRTDGSTTESLADNAPGAAVWLRDVTQFKFDAVPYTAGHSLPMLEVTGNMVEERTGISRSGQGLDTNALRKSGQMTATEMAMISAGKNARVEMMARIFAETGVKRLFKLIYKLVTQHQPRERIIRLRNKFIPVDPRNWPEMDIEISVGLGIGDKGEQIAIADGILEVQAALAQTAFSGMVKPQHVFNTIRKKLNAGGIKNVEDFIGSPDELQGQPEQPSPEQMKMQAEMQMQAAKLQADRQLAEAKLSGEQQAAAARLETMREEALLKQQLAREEAEFEAQLALEKMEREHALAIRRMEMEEALAVRKQATAEAVDLSDNRPGGRLDE